MPQISEIYSKGVKQKLKNYWSSWLPSTAFKLGDIGELNGYVFEKIGSLDELGIPFAVEDDTSPSPIELLSESGVSVKLKLAGEVNEAFVNVPKGDAGIKLGFGNKGSFVVSCAETYEPAILDIMALQKRILNLYSKGKWNPEWNVITRIVESPRATIIISNSSNSELELSAGADLAAGILELGKAGVDIQLKSQRGDMIKVIGGSELTPFFQLGAVKKRIFKEPKFKTRSMMAGEIDATNPVRGKKEDPIEELYFDVLRDDEV